MDYCTYQKSVPTLHIAHCFLRIYIYMSEFGGCDLKCVLYTQWDGCPLRLGLVADKPTYCGFHIMYCTCILIASVRKFTGVTWLQSSESHLTAQTLQ